MRILITVILGMVLLAGCAANRPSMTRDEFLSTTQKTYADVSERQFYAAAERLFKLSDEKDTTFAYPGEHAMLVQRDWSMYMVLAYGQGTHHWRIETSPVEDGLKGTVYASMESTAVSGAPTGGGGAATVTTPMAGSMVNEPALYELFWARMDYLLGKSEDWPTCEDWKAKIKAGDTYGIIEPLCLGMNTDDKVPNGAPEG